MLIILEINSWNDLIGSLNVGRVTQFSNYKWTTCITKSNRLFLLLFSSDHMIFDVEASYEHARIYTCIYMFRHFEHGRGEVWIERRYLGRVIGNTGVFRWNGQNDRETWNVGNTVAIIVDILVGQVRITSSLLTLYKSYDFNVQYIIAMLAISVWFFILARCHKKVYTTNVSLFSFFFLKLLLRITMKGNNVTMRDSVSLSLHFYL